MEVECPHCRSTELLIRQVSGLERLRVFFTGLRTFKCQDCYSDFRAPDRRRSRRRLSAQEKREAGLFAARQTVR